MLDAGYEMKNGRCRMQDARCRMLVEDPVFSGNSGWLEN